MIERHHFIIRFLDQSLTDEELLQATELLKDPHTADALVQHALVKDLLEIDASMTWGENYAQQLKTFLQEQTLPPALVQDVLDVSAAPQLPPALSDRKLSPRRRGGRVWLAAALTLLVAITLLWTSLRPSEPQFHSLPLATISHSVNIEWTSPETALSVGSRLRSGSVIELASGLAEITFDSGAVTVLTGPCRFEIQSSSQVSLTLGTATTRVETPNSGFRIDTPTAIITDLGTQFGTYVAKDGATDVAVFEGTVELRSKPRAGQPPAGHVQQLTKGEGLSIDRYGRWQRLVSVSTLDFPFGSDMYRVERSRAPIIAGISDNRNEPENFRFYRTCPEGLTEDARAYVDRVYEWNGLTEEGIPFFLRNADYIQMFNDDKKDLSPLINVDIAGPAMLYVFYDDRMVIPEWLSRDFTDTGVDIGLDEGTRDMTKPTTGIDVGPGRSVDVVCSVWQREIPEPMVVKLGRLGEPKHGEKRVRRSMYGIAARPLPVSDLKK
ncbi:FecR domain-containing protein [Planctomicrobium sp. SH664]|uniref:FecR domain-containing protein n=1 Tax=Planctomicrobium sp. SH664 TaxID=3448125 RepID=UPI003F5C088C